MWQSRSRSWSRSQQFLRSSLSLCTYLGEDAKSCASNGPVALYAGCKRQTRCTSTGTIRGPQSARRHSARRQPPARTRRPWRPVPSSVVHTRNIMQPYAVTLASCYTCLRGPNSYAVRKHLVPTYAVKAKGWLIQCIPNTEKLSKSILPKLFIMRRISTRYAWYNGDFTVAFFYVCYDQSLWLITIYFSTLM